MLKFVTFLLVTILVVSDGRNVLKKTPKVIVDPTNCYDVEGNDLDDGQIACYSCKNKVLCLKSNDDSMVAYSENCEVTGQVCNIAADAKDAECISTPANNEPGAECFCNPSLPQPRTEPDVYTQYAYLVCNYNITSWRPCENNYIYKSDFGVCSPQAPTCEFVGIFPFEDDCDFYYVCSQVGAQGNVKMCDEGQFFDENVGRCNDIPDTTITCYYDDSSPITGLVPRPTYCNSYYVCDQGTYISTEWCESGMIFSSDDNKCILDDGSCISTYYCFGWNTK